MMESRKAATTSRGGLAARARGGTKKVSKMRTGYSGESTITSDTRGGWARSTPPDGSAAVVSAPASQWQNNRRFKQIASVAAFAIALAVVSLMYGLWSVASSRTAIEAVTAGAQPTLVSTTDIQAGDIVDSSSVELKDIPQSFRVSTALDSHALEGDGQVEGRRALVDIPAGAQITSGFVTGTENGDHLAAQLQGGMEAVTLSVDTETGLAGRVQAYDMVRVVSAESDSTDSSLLTTVCERARVIATGESTNDAGGSYTSVTVEVTPSEADAIREAQYAGRVSLLLVSSNDALAGDVDRG